MASKKTSYANEDRRARVRGATVDIPFLVLILLLLLVGLTMLYSASFAQSEYDTGYEISTRYLQKQAVCAAIGLVAMYIFSRIPPAVWYNLAWVLYGISIVLLLSVLVIGEEVNGAKRWINLAGIQGSFVVFGENGGTVVSGRSYGQVNVQVVLEKIGGGGSLNMAGAQFPTEKPEQVELKLRAAIEEYLRESQPQEVNV